MPIFPAQPLMQDALTKSIHSRLTKWQYHKFWELKDQLTTVRNLYINDEQLQRQRDATETLQIFNLLKPKLTLCTTNFDIQKFCVLPTMYLCVLRGSQNNQRLFPYTA